MADSYCFYVNYSKSTFLFEMAHVAGFRPNSEIIGKFRKMKKFYDHFVQLEK